MILLLCVWVLQVVFSIPYITYPVVFSTIRNLNLASSNILKNIGIEGSMTSYNILSLNGWTIKNGITGAALFWSNPSKYLITKKYGSLDKDIQNSLKAEYKKRGIQILVHAFSDN